MIAIAFPETEAVLIEQHETAHPFHAFPGVEMRHDEAHWAAMVPG